VRGGSVCVVRCCTLLLPPTICTLRVYVGRRTPSVLLHRCYYVSGYKCSSRRRNVTTTGCYACGVLCSMVIRHKQELILDIHESTHVRCALGSKVEPRKRVISFCSNLCSHECVFYSRDLPESAPDLKKSTNNSRDCGVTVAMSCDCS